MADGKFHVTYFTRIKSFKTIFFFKEKKKKPIPKAKPVWRRAWQPTPVFLPGEFHRQRSLVGYSPSGRKELNMKDHLTLPLHFLLFKATGVS